MIEYRESILGDARDQLGLLSLTFADNMNDLQTLGLDLNGEFGSEMFADINSADAVSNRLVSNSENTASVLESEVYLVDLSAVQATEYTLEFDSRSQVTLERADGESWTFEEADSQASAAAVDEDGEFYLDSSSGELVIQQDGMLISLEISTTRSPVGDSYTIQPTPLRGEQHGAAAQRWGGTGLCRAGDRQRRCRQSEQRRVDRHGQQQRIPKQTGQLHQQCGQQRQRHCG